LEEKTVDTGRFGFSTSYNYDYFQIQQALRPDFVGIVAESPNDDGLVGVGLLSFGECQVEGQRMPYGYLGGLGVHLDYRRQGISTAITTKMMEIVRERYGGECVVSAGIQAGNEGSLKANMKWANQQFNGRTRAAFGKTYSKPPRSLDGVSVLRVDEEKLEEAAAQQNEFYQNTNLYPPKTAAQLKAWLDKRPFGHEINRYYAAVDRGGNLLAGTGVTLVSYLTATHVSRIPWLLKAVNAVLKLLPVEEGTKNLNGHWFWYRDGQESTGAYLWEMVKYLEHEHANMSMLFFDHTGPVGRAISVPRFPPQSDGYLVVNAPCKLQEDRPLYFNNLLV
jgi:GNAT superfamily N-acetyltransferase